MIGVRVDVLADAGAAAARGAEEITAAGSVAIAERGRFLLAVSGGTEPWRMFGLLDDRALDWRRTEIFQVDERVAPDGDGDRNLSHLRESLPAAALERIRPMPVTAEDLDAAAGRYAASLPEAFDLIHLGIGPDGHTASLVPGDPVLEVRDRLVALTGEYQGRRRMTLTYPVLEAARRIIWLIPGAAKREPLRRLLAGDRSIPAGRVEASRATVIADRDALPAA
jgi:6-phosphogluconolactonase